MTSKLLLLYSSPKLADKCSKRGWVLLILLVFSCTLCAQYPIHYHPVDKDSTFIADVLKLQTRFQSGVDADEYIRRIPELLGKKGYGTASIDSFSIDSGSASVSL